jgi:hypothetical protein
LTLPQELDKVTRHHANKKCNLMNGHIFNLSKLRAPGREQKVSILATAALGLLLWAGLAGA